MMIWLCMLTLQAFSGLPETPQIRVTGHATVSSEPEQASLDFGVTAEAADADAAARDNAAKLDTVLRALRETLGADAQLETVGYAIHPNYRQRSPGAEPVIAGYVATNTVRAEGLPIESVGAAIDAATAAGANNVNNVRFSLRNEDAARSEALKAAATDARAKADALAEALGLSIIRVLTVTESETGMPRPMPMYRAEMAMAQGDVSTPVEPGMVEIHAQVTLVVEIAQ